MVLSQTWPRTRGHHSVLALAARAQLEGSGSTYPVREHTLLPAAQGERKPAGHVLVGHQWETRSEPGIKAFRWKCVANSNWTTTPVTLQLGTLHGLRRNGLRQRHRGLCPSLSASHPAPKHSPEPRAGPRRTGSRSAPRSQSLLRAAPGPARGWSNPEPETQTPAQGPLLPEDRGHPRTSQCRMAEHPERPRLPLYCPGSLGKARGHQPAPPDKDHSHPAIKGHAVRVNVPRVKILPVNSSWGATSSSAEGWAAARSPENLCECHRTLTGSLSPLRTPSPGSGTVPLCFPWSPPKRRL